MSAIPPRPAAPAVDALDDALRRVADLVAATERDGRRRHQETLLRLEERAAELDDIARGLRAAAAAVEREHAR
ncbi:hypothetical protein ACVU7I_13170, partial [Patulibacter sp. S7RM1-6]